MSQGYRAVQWNRQKRRYDATLWLGIVVYLGAFLGVGFTGFPQVDETTLLIRALGTAALLLLHLILVIGPLCRLWPRFLPLLYNRRHLGVSMFALALTHALLATIQYHALGNLNPLVSVLSSDGSFEAGQIPFQPLGALALLILFAMATTSHDFWLATLTPAIWKALHMGVYLAYAMLVLHVALGVLQLETHPAYAALLLTGVTTVIGLHLLAGWRERPLDRPDTRAADESWIDAGPALTIRDRRARIVSIGGERVAVFRYDDQISALSNVCRHQNGPLGEGCIRDGLVTCPWHGYQYRPHDGRSPPPFDEQVATYAVRIVDGRVQVAAQASAPGTAQIPARITRPIAR